VHPSDARPQPGRDRTAGRLSALRIIGALVALVAIALCVRTLADSWPQVRTAVANANVAWLLAALACSAASMIGLGLLWWRCLQLFGAPAKPAAAVAWYFGGELGKYLPGGVWTVLGRGELAHRSGLTTRGVGYTTTLISYGVMCVAAAVVDGVLAPFVAIDGGLGWTWALLLLVPLGVAVVHPAVLGRLLAATRQLTRGRLDLSPPPWPAMLRLIGCSVPTWVAIGAAAVLITEALGYHQDPSRVAFAAITAWIVGFLAVPVPAGAGLRELIFVLTCGLAAAPATAVAAIARLMLLVVDGTGGVLGLWYARHTIAPPTAVAAARADSTDRS
jgi:glycosyltransferase 2 family protein